MEGGLRGVEEEERGLLECSVCGAHLSNDMFMIYGAHFSNHIYVFSQKGVWSPFFKRHTNVFSQKVGWRHTYLYF